MLVLHLPWVCMSQSLDHIIRVLDTTILSLEIESSPWPDGEWVVRVLIPALCKEYPNACGAGGIISDLKDVLNEIIRTIPQSADPASARAAASDLLRPYFGSTVASRRLPSSTQAEIWVDFAKQLQGFRKEQFRNDFSGQSKKIAESVEARKRKERFFDTLRVLFESIPLQIQADEYFETPQGLTDFMLFDTDARKASEVSTKGTNITLQNGLELAGKQLVPKNNPYAAAGLENGLYTWLSIFLYKLGTAGEQLKKEGKPVRVLVITQEVLNKLRESQKSYFQRLNIALEAVREATPYARYNLENYQPFVSALNDISVNIENLVKSLVDEAEKGQPGAPTTSPDKDKGQPAPEAQPVEKDRVYLKLEAALQKEKCKTVTPEDVAALREKLERNRAQLGLLRFPHTITITGLSKQTSPCVTANTNISIQRIEEDDE